MEKILELASRLGQEIRRHERYLLLREAEKKVMTDPEAMKIQDDLEKQLQKLRDLEIELKPIEVADKRALSSLQEKARSNPGLRELLKTQADYFEMMNKVNSAILAELAPSEHDRPD